MCNQTQHTYQIEATRTSIHGTHSDCKTRHSELHGLPMAGQARPAVAMAITGRPTNIPFQHADTPTFTCAIHLCVWHKHDHAARVKRNLSSGQSCSVVARLATGCWLLPLQLLACAVAASHVVPLLPRCADRTNKSCREHASPGCMRISHYSSSII